MQISFLAEPFCAPPTRLKSSLLILTLLLGGLHGQAFAPLNGWWLELICLTALFGLSRYANNAKQAAYLGFAFGLSWFASGIWWIYISLHQYGHLPALLAVIAVLLLCAFLALFPAFALGLTHALYYQRHATPFLQQKTLPPSMHILVAGGAWGLSEWLRGSLFTGFPWLASGYAHADGPLAGYAALVGVYGMSAIAAGLAVTLNYLWHKRPTPTKLYREPLVFSLVFILSVGCLAPKYRFTEALKEAISVRLVQGNIAQDLKFDQTQFELNLRQQTMLITAAPANLIVAPETAFPLLLSEFPATLIKRLSEFARASGSQILFGAIGEKAPVEFAPPPSASSSLSSPLLNQTEIHQAEINQTGVSQPPANSIRLSNSVLTLDGYRYDKMHLVPFGEFIPWGFRWFVSLMQIPLGDFSSGAVGQAPLLIKGTALAPNICYEDLFGEEIARNLRIHRANILLNSTNIAWFGNTRAVDQHLQIARLRSLETQLPTLRSTNTGATVWIDDHGQVRAQLPRFVSGSLAVTVHGSTGLTPFVRWGNLPFLIFSGTILLLACGLRLRKK